MVRKNPTKKKPKTTKKKPVKFTKAGVLPGDSLIKNFDRSYITKTLFAIFVAVILYAIVDYAKDNTPSGNYFVGSIDEKWAPVPADKTAVIPEEKLPNVTYPEPEKKKLVSKKTHKVVSKKEPKKTSVRVYIPRAPYRYHTTYDHSYIQPRGLFVIR